MKEGLYVQVTPSSSHSSTNHMFQINDVSRPIQLGQHADQAGGLPGQEPALLCLEDWIVTFPMYCSPDCIYVMELSTRYALLDDLTSVCEPLSINLTTLSSQYQTKWMINSGASAHFTRTTADFSSVQMGFFGIVHTAFTPQHIKGQGTVFIEHLVIDPQTGAKSTHVTKLWPVFYIEGTQMWLISASQLLQSGLRLEADVKMHVFWDEKNRALITGVSGHYQNILAVLSKIIKRHPKEFVKALQPADYLTWHRRLRHPSDFVWSWFCEKTLGVPRIMITKTKAVCDGCVKGKLTQKQFPPSESWAKGILELIHLDLFELPVISYHYHKWIMTVMDDYPGIAFIIMISKKSDAPHQMIKVLTFLATSTGQKVKWLCTDWGGEYTSRVLKEYLDAVEVVFVCLQIN
jgi:hypothetical protein